jgi:hypothetical protein
MNRVYSLIAFALCSQALSSEAQLKPVDRRALDGLVNKASRTGDEPSHKKLVNELADYDRGISYVLAKYSSEDENVRWLIIFVCKENARHDPRWTIVIGLALADKEKFIRASAFSGLADIKTPLADELILEGFKDIRDPQFKKRIFDLTVKAKPHLQPRLLL